MTKTVGIYYFSGTGNTKLVAELLSKELQKKALLVDLIDICTIIKNKSLVDPTKYDLIGIAYPVYALNAPRIIYQFLKVLPRNLKKKVFLLRTAGDNVFNAGHTDSIKTKLKKVDYEVFNEKLIIMPSNVFFNYNPRAVKQLYQAAVRKISNVAVDILEQRVRLSKKVAWWKIIFFTFLRSQQQFGCRFSSLWFKVSKNCNLCGKCVRECPQTNLFVANKKIKTKNNCLACMRCVYGCPQKAFVGRLWGKLLIIKEGYLDLLKIINNPNIKADYINENTRGYFAHYLKYLKED